MFILYAVVDAIIHENSMELAASGVLGLMILARVAWFAATSTSGLNFTVTWTVLLGVSQAVQILLAALSYRQFGWRLYSQLGVDVRRRGASARWRAALLRHGFWTASKLDIMFLIVLSLLGVDVSVEKRETVQVALLTVAVVGFFVGLSLTIFGAYLVRRRQRDNSSNNSSSSGTSRKSYSNTIADNKLEFMFHCLMPLSFAQPIATIAIYALMTGLDLANAGISLNIASAFFMITRLVVWVLCTLVLRTIDKSGHNNDRDSDEQQQQQQQQQPDDNSINNNNNNNHHRQKALDPLMAGTWLGKPTPNNPKKIRFIQLSQDCSTLRWGWHGYVRLFYVEELMVNEADMTLTISFALDPLLILKFFDKGTFDTWRMGLDKAMLTIMAPTADVMTMNTTRNSNGGIAGLLSPPSVSAASSPDTDKSIIATISSALSPFTISPSVPSSSMQPLHLEQSESKDRHALSKLGVKMAHGGSSLSGRLSLVRVVSGEQTHLQHGDGLEGTASIQQRKRRSLVEFLMRHQNTGGEDENRMHSSKTSAAAKRKRSKKKKISNRVQHYIDSGTQTDTSPPLLLLDTNNGTQKEEFVIQGDEAIAAQYLQAMAGAYVAADNQDDNDNDDNNNDAQIQDDQLDRGGGGGGGGGGGSSSTAISNIPLLNDCWLTAASITVDIVEYQDLTFGKLLGDGSEGSVYAAWLHDSPVAIKQFNNPASSTHEVQMYLKAGTHDNIVGLRGLCMHDNSVYLVLEYCPRGTLDLLIHDSSSARRVLLREQPDKTLLPIVRSIARGVRHLHMRGIIHRDLKSGNIFVGHGYQMKVGDLGCARIIIRNEGGGGNSEGDSGLRRLSPGVIGTQKYSAPELTNTDLRPVDMADWEWASMVDVWSFGCVVWELIEGKRPFEGMSDAALAAKYLNDPFEMRLPTRGGGGGGGRGVREEKGRRIYRGLEDLVEDCTRVDPLSRPSFKEILRRLQALA